MNSVDLFGFRRILDNPAVNFLYLQGEKPCRDSVVKAIRNHHTIAACAFDEADVTLSGNLPGSVIAAAEAEKMTVEISAKIAQGVIKEVRVYSGSEVIFSTRPESKEISLSVKLAGKKLDKFVRVEAEGEDPGKIMVSTPFFID